MHSAGGAVRIPTAAAKQCILQVAADKLSVSTAIDMPNVETLIVKEHEPTGLFDAKGVAEPANVPTAQGILT